MLVGMQLPLTGANLMLDIRHVSEELVTLCDALPMGDNRVMTMILYIDYGLLILGYLKRVNVVIDHGRGLQ